MPVMMRAIACFLAAAAACVGVAAPFAYISNSGSNNVSVIDVATQTVVATVPVGTGPFGVAVSADGTRAYVANQGDNSITVIDTGTQSVLGSPIAVGAAPKGIAVSPDGKLAVVANSGSNTVSFVDLQTRNVTTLPVGASPYGVAFDPTGARAYVTNNGAASVSVIDIAARSLSGAAIPVGQYPTGIAVSPLGTVAYVANYLDITVSTIDLQTRAVSTFTLRPSAFSYNTGPIGVAVGPRGQPLYVADSDDYSFFAQLLTIDPVTHLQSRLDDPVPQFSAGMGVALEPTGTFAYLANYAGNHVAVINVLTQTFVATVPVGTQPVAFGQFIQLAASTIALNVAKAGGGTGAVVSTPSGIDCGTTCSIGFAPGTQVTLTATATGQSYFVGWSEPGCSGSTCTFTVGTTAKSVTATFDAYGFMSTYRLYSPLTSEHLYTTDFKEYSVLPTCCAWYPEGVAFHLVSAPATISGVQAIALRRLYNPYSYQHLWTTDANEYAVLGALGWVQEGLVGYILPYYVAGYVPLYRLYLNQFGGLHLWTTDSNEVALLTRQEGWQFELVVGYVMPPP